MITISYKLFYDTFSVVQYFTMITFLPWIQGNFIISCVLFPYISPDTLNYIIWKMQWILWFTCTFVCGKGDTAFHIGPRSLLSHNITSSISKINKAVLLLENGFEPDNTTCWVPWVMGSQNLYIMYISFTLRYHFYCLCYENIFTCTRKTLTT